MVAILACSTHFDTLEKSSNTLVNVLLALYKSSGLWTHTNSNLWNFHIEAKTKPKKIVWIIRLTTNES